MNIVLRNKTYISDIVWSIIFMIILICMIINALRAHIVFPIVLCIMMIMVIVKLIKEINTNYTYLEDFEQLYEHYPYDITNIKLDTVTRSSRSRRSSSTYYFDYGLLQFTYNNIEYAVRIYDIEYYYILRKLLKDDNVI